MPPAKTTSKMDLLDDRLMQRRGISLQQYLIQARRISPDHPVQSWDQIAHDLWNITGVSAVRETMINYGRRYGLAADRALRSDEEPVPPDDDHDDPTHAEAA
jgi:hypothetical protein